MELSRKLMKNFKFLILILFVLFVGFFVVKTISADSVIDNAVSYLKSKQDTTGKITGGSTGDASPWTTIAFAANGIDITTVKNSTNSLKDYLLNNAPTISSSATEWEKWILAITASGFNPYDFGGTDYVATLKSSIFYNNNQIGDTNSVNDDWFGVLALISSGVSNLDPVLTSSLDFIIKHQNSDYGYGYSTTVESDSNDTAAAIQALVAAKNYGVANTNLDGAITNAKTYLLNTQDISGGFLYDTSPWTTAPDSDSTTWALMALNALGMKDSDQVNTAKTWLLLKQAGDGGFQACQYNPPDYICQLASNSTTTSHALIGFAGKYWIVNIFDTSTITPTPTLSITPTVTLTPMPTIIPTSTPTPTVTPTPTPTSTPQPTSTLVPTSTPMPIPTPTLIPTITYSCTGQACLTPTSTPTPSIGQILGIKTKETKPINQQSNKNTTATTIAFFGLGLLFSIIDFVRFHI